MTRFFLKGRRHTQPGKAPALAALIAIAVVAGLTTATPPAQAQTGPVLNEVAKLLADDGAAGDQFGRSVSFSGDTVVIGAFGSNVNDPGSAYVFVRDANGDWTQQAKLLASDGVISDNFGFSVSISGDTAVIGASNDGDNGANTGSAYVFVRNANGAWTQQAKLLADDGASGDSFGFSVAISGDTVIVSASSDNDNGQFSGSSYIFIRDAKGVWAQQAKLLADDGGEHDQFGRSVFISEDTAIVGAPRNNGASTDSGAAYVFVRGDNGLWTQQAKLVASDGDMHDSFGNAVAFSGDTAIVGAPHSFDDVNDARPAYVFKRNEENLWTEQAKLYATDGVADDQFGVSVAIDNDTVVIGSLPPLHIVQAGDDLSNSNTEVTREVSVGAFGPGAAYVFMRDANDDWTQQVKLLASDGYSEDDLGVSVGLSGDSVIAGASLDNDNGGASGAAYVFNLRPADLNANGVVDGDDLSALLMQWGTDGGADLNGDGVVDGVDLATLLTNWG